LTRAGWCGVERKEQLAGGARAPLGTRRGGWWRSGISGNNILAKRRQPHQRAAIEYNRTMWLQRLHHVQLAMPVDSEPRAREFYQGLLGIPEVAKPPQLASRGGCWFERGELLQASGSGG
jgi:hypothetical protein